ncbi:hypothetical protein EQZ23_17780 [Sphingomonas sp. UV9]|uniref:hypothetical protein n=1 Tax=Sphingomonas sp. UV9 TaxID=1851410 RepID=UPI000FFC27A4|nr:hypothetical protein [Sphingomonas sp. UV9]RXD02474.1 hypothetical protein EQZ23_17780 [Sphingomonas sp. UV9]
MTKPRIPDSFPDAMGKVLAQLGRERAAAVVGKSVSTVYEWAKEDTPTLPSLMEALALDTAHRLAGGEDAPFRDAFSHQLDIEVDQQDACRRALISDSVEFIGEAGDLQAALFIAVQPGASPLDLHRALVEVTQVEGVVRRLRRRLPRFLRPAMSTGPGNAGGTHQ